MISLKLTHLRVFSILSSMRSISPKILFALLLIIPHVVTANPCSFLDKRASLVHKVTSIEKTVSLASYIESLLETNILNEGHIKKIVMDIESGLGFKNPIPLAEALADPTLMVHYRGLSSDAKAKDLDLGFLKKRLKGQLQREKQEKKEKKQVGTKTLVPFQRMEFVVIKKGSFKESLSFTDPKDRRKIRFKKAFGFQSTLVTQWQWFKIMGENPSRFNDGAESTTLGGIKMRPDHPVEQIDIKLVADFIERLNSLSKNNDPLIYEVIPDHQKNRKYSITTKQQWEYVARNRGRNKKKFFFGDKEAELANYAWFEANSRGETQAVQLKQPLIVDGQKIYDLYGNVWHMVTYKPLINMARDGFGFRNYLMRGKGGSFMSTPIRCQTIAESNTFKPMENDSFGIRLVYELD